MAVRIANTVRNNMIDVIRAAIDAGPAAGRLKIYAGALPATKGDAPAGALLADIPLADPCGVSAAGVLTFTVPAEDTSADATGTAAFFYLEDSTGAFVSDGSAGVGGAFNLNLVTTAIVATQPVEITSFTVTAGNN